MKNYDENLGYVLPPEDATTRRLMRAMFYALVAFPLVIVVIIILF